MFKSLLTAALASALLLLPTARVQADVHGLVGVLGAAAIICGNGGCNGNRSSGGGGGGGGGCGPQCQSNVEMQRALAFFGYNPGGADGAWGPNSRRAASGFEAEMGFYPVDGVLNDAERAFLVSSYNRAQSGYFGVPQHQQAYVRGGPRALLVSFNDERLGRLTAPQAPATTTVVAPAPTTTVVQPAPSIAEAVQPAPQQPSFSGFTVATPAPSMTAFCANAQQAAPDATTTLVGAAIDQVMGLQFCAAMVATRDAGAALRGSIQGMTAEQVVAQCQGLSGVMAPTLASLGTQPREGAELAARGALSGMATDQAVTAGHICLSVGYEEDDAAMALASALVLASQGDASYGEIVGHHLRQGFGVDANEAAARDWHLSTVEAMDAGAAPGFLADQALGRMAIIRGAYQGSGGLPETTVTDAAAGATTLPTFTLGGNN